ncbi:hypothetical protein K439DRAFT_409628 [Ramaria rubella]|nr:hypothetical protein K439DRAFT_409628 [Ramaria rubella]
MDVGSVKQHSSRNLCPKETSFNVTATHGIQPTWSFSPASHQFNVQAEAEPAGGDMPAHHADVPVQILDEDGFLRARRLNPRKSGRLLNLNHDKNDKKTLADVGSAEVSHYSELYPDPNTSKLPSKQAFRQQDFFVTPSYQTPFAHRKTLHERLQGEQSHQAQLTSAFDSIQTHRLRTPPPLINEATSSHLSRVVANPPTSSINPDKETLLQPRIPRVCKVS